MRLAVAGAGYVGLATAVGFARHGYFVTLFDIDPYRIDCLRAGTPPFSEPSVNGALEAALGETLEIADASLELPSDFDFMFICVGTPPRADGSLDVSAVRHVATRTAAASEGRTAIVIRSTVLPGTAASLESEIREQFPDATVLANPEFLREGHALDDFEHPPRRVIGGSRREALEALKGLYSFSDSPVLCTDATSAELIKVGSNAALAVRVSMANEIADVAAALHLDPEAVLAAIGADPRIGGDYLSPGIGFGGTCLPKDLDAYRATSRAVRARSNVFDGTAATNAESLDRLVDRVVELMDGAEARVCVAGLGFKRGSDQVRGSRALLLVEALLERRIPVSVCDPLAEDSARAALGDSVEYVCSLDALRESHRVVVLAQGGHPFDQDLPSHLVVIDGLGREVREHGRNGTK